MQSGTELPIEIRKQFYDEFEEILWEVEVAPPGSDRFRFILFNKKYQDIVGVGHEKMGGGKLIENALSPATAEHCRTQYYKCVKAKAQITYPEYLDIGGAWRWWRTTLKPRLNEAGLVFRIVGTAEPITPLEAELRNAIAVNNLAVHYQPIYQLSNNTLAGYEALIRWPESGRSPAKFLPLAKAVGLMPEITNFVVKEAAHAVATINRKQTAEPLWVSVNISNCPFEAAVQKAVAENDISPELLRFEITEETVLNPELIQRFARINALGHLLKIDDFGTEGSNLNWLNKIKAMALKLDMQFVRGAYQDSNKSAICEATVRLAHGYTPRLEVIAEGIETTKDLDFIHGLGIDYGQGYLFGQAEPLKTLIHS